MYEKLKNDYNELFRKQPRTKEMADALKKLESKIKHYKNKMDFKGENHSQNPKGN